MKQNNHKHQALIESWANDKSTEFELAYGTGVDFVWVDCGINEVINNESAQIRIKRKKPKKEKRWIAIYSDGTVCDRNKRTKDEIVAYVERGPYYGSCAPELWQFIEIEVEI